MRTGKIIKRLKNFGELKVEDKKWLSENKTLLFEFVKNNPAKEAAAIRHYILEKPFLKLKPIPIVIGVIIAALLAGGGTVYASQFSLPGDAFYPIKLLSENAQTALTFNSEKKVELETKFANRRLEEIQKLQERIQKKNGGIPPEIVEKAMERAEQKLERAQERIAQMEEGQRKDMALGAASRLEEALQTHQQILSDLAEEAPEPAWQALLHAQEMATKHSTQAFEKILRLEKAKKAGEKIKEKIEEREVPKILGAEERAEGKLKALENRLRALESYIENLKGRGIEVSKEAEIKFEEAKKKMEEVKNLLKEEKYLEAFDVAGEAMRLLMEAKLLLRSVLTHEAFLEKPMQVLPQPVPIEPGSLPAEPMILPVGDSINEVEAED